MNKRSNCNNHFADNLQVSNIPKYSHASNVTLSDVALARVDLGMFCHMLQPDWLASCISMVLILPIFEFDWLHNV